MIVIPAKAGIQKVTGCRIKSGMTPLVTSIAGLIKIVLAELKTLRGIIPICPNCIKIRDDQGFWQQVESYVTKHTKASFSHGICPECIAKLYGDIHLKVYGVNKSLWCQNS